MGLKKSQRPPAVGFLFSVWKRRVRRALLLFAWCSVFWALACGEETADDVLADYSRRVHNTLEIESPAAYASALLSYPRHRELYLELDDVRIGLIELVSLQRCGLEELVAERNSGLGKVMPPSQQLLYEHRLLAGARVCVDTLLATGEAPDLLARLREVVQIKERDMPRAYWNATFASSEFAKHFSLATRALPLVQEQDPVPQLEALYYLRDLSAALGRSEWALDPERLEQCFFSLQNRSYGGQLLQSMDLLAFYLRDIAEAIEARQHGQTICPQGLPTPKAKIMQTVFLKFYAGKTQPYLARVHREGRAWIDAVDGLVAAQNALAASFADYRARQLDPGQPVAVWARFDAAIQRHTSAWQALFAECGMSALTSAEE